jgi:signal peptidase I
MTAVTVETERELMLSGPALQELISEVHYRGVPVRFSAAGTSMSPFINDGDILTLSPCSSATLKTGDIVAFMNSGTDHLVIHRIVAFRGGQYLVRGDNAFNCDGLISKSYVLGRVSGIMRNGEQQSLGLGVEKYLIAFLSRQGLLTNILMPLWRYIRPLIRWRK